MAKKNDDVRFEKDTPHPSDSNTKTKNGQRNNDDADCSFHAAIFHAAARKRYLSVRLPL